MKVQKVLVTGASGFIGRKICPYLESRGYTLRNFDRCPSGIVEDAFEGRLEDLSALQRVVAGVDTIIHLAARSDDADFVSRLVPSNVIGLYHAFEAARLEGVRRFILASSCQAADLVGRLQKVSVEDRFPTDHYGLTKLWAEDMGRMYSWRYGLSVLAVRLGWVVRSAAELKQMNSLPGGKELFLSHRDLRGFFYSCLQADAAPFAVIYAFSKQVPVEIFDMEPTKRIVNYDPQDVFPNGLDFECTSQE
jgi:uronate dehydrogenase